jgi:anti-anti-sigma factor
MTTKPIFAFDYESGVVVLESQVNLGALTYHQYEHDLKHVLDALLVDQARHVVIDVEKSSYFGSAVLGFFVGVWRIARRRSGAMIMCGVSPFALEILRIAALDTLWPICRTRTEALEILRPHVTPSVPCSRNGEPTSHLN